MEREVKTSKLNYDLKNKILEKIEKDANIEVNCLMGDPEGLKIAKQIKNFLEGERYSSVEGVHLVIMEELYQGIKVFNGPYEEGLDYTIHVGRT